MIKYLLRLVTIKKTDESELTNVIKTIINGNERDAKVMLNAYKEAKFNLQKNGLYEFYKKDISDQSASKKYEEINGIDDIYWQIKIVETAMKPLVNTAQQRNCT